VENPENVLMVAMELIKVLKEEATQVRIFDEKCRWADIVNNFENMTFG